LRAAINIQSSIRPKRLDPNSN